MSDTSPSDNFSRNGAHLTGDKRCRVYFDKEKKSPRPRIFQNVIAEVTVGLFADGAMAAITIQSTHLPFNQQAMLELVCDGVTIGLQEGVPFEKYRHYFIGNLTPLKLKEAANGLVTNILAWAYEEALQLRDPAKIIALSGAARPLTLPFIKAGNISDPSSFR